MKKQQIISITGISLMAALFFGEGCCCPTLPIGEILIFAAIADLFDAIASNSGEIFFCVILPIVGVFLLFAIISAIFK